MDEHGSQRLLAYRLRKILKLHILKLGSQRNVLQNKLPYSIYNL